MFENEGTLIEGLIANKDSAFRFAIKESQPSMMYLTDSMVSNKLADEVVQEAWFAALRPLPKFERHSKLKTWLLRIVVNEAKTRLRKENRQVSLDEMLQRDSALYERFSSKGHWQDNPFDWDADSPDKILSTGELKSCIEEMPEALPELQGATLNLREQQDYSLA